MNFELFDDAPGLAGAQNPDTSKQAAASLTGSGTKRRILFECIARSYEDGMTVDALVDATDIPANVAWPRVHELRDSGVIERCEHTVKTRSGRSAHPWILTDEGIDIAMEIV